jgi:RNA polymerase sigma factor (sigma-70 family)
VRTGSLSAAVPENEAARLFEQYGAQLYRFCLGRMRSREEAEDAVQSTFLRVHKALAKGDVPQFEAAWLYKIAHNVCLSRKDALGRRGRLESPHDLDDVEYALAAPEERHDELAGLSDALAGMAPNLRQALLLREWQGLSYLEIAAAMDTTVSAVETLIFRARRDLARSLERDGKPAGIAGALNIGVLLERARSLLLGAAPAKLAAGAALVAIGGAGVGTAVALNHKPAPAPASTTRPAAHAVSVPTTVHAAVLTFTPVRTRTHAAATPAAPVSAPAPQQPQTPTSSSPASPPGQAAAPVTPPQAPTVEPPSVTASVPPLPAPTVPGIATPPAPQLPTVQTPTVQAPTVQAPSLPALPTVSLPTP